MEEVSIFEIDKVRFNSDLARIKKINDQISKVNLLIKENKLSKEELPPFGIYLNNKIVEVFNFVRSKGIPYSRSALARSTFSYILYKYLEPAISALDEFGSANQSLFSGIKRIFGKPNKIKKLRECISLGKQLADYDIIKSAEEAINYDLDDYMSEDFYNGGINEDIDRINDELKQLGIDLTIAYREDTVKKEKTVTEKISEKMEEMRPELEKMEEMRAEIEKDKEFLANLDIELGDEDSEHSRTRR